MPLVSRLDVWGGVGAVLGPLESILGRSWGYVRGTLGGTLGGR